MNLLKDLCNVTDVDINAKDDMGYPLLMVAAQENENPEIIRRAPLHNVASFLQMTPETLSRVRAQVTEEGIK
jgi:hypothetical protein